MRHLTQWQAQLRANVIQDLSAATDRPVRPDRTTLSSRLADSLVADHLRALQLEYTLSVYLPESGNQGNLFNRDDVLNVGLNVQGVTLADDEQAVRLPGIPSKHRTTTSLIDYLVQFYVHQHRAGTSSTGTQTSDTRAASVILGTCNLRRS